MQVVALLLPTQLTVLPAALALDPAMTLTVEMSADE
jgi:hypothetical protein